MVDRPFLATIEYQRQQWRSLVEGAHPMILEFQRIMVKRMAKLGVPMYAHCTVRTEDEQRKLFVDGFTKDSPDDGLWPHRGTAVDIVHGVKQWGLDKRQWALVGHVGKNVVAPAIGAKMVWGGDWKFYDPAHWELANWREIAHEYPWPI